MSDLNLSKQVAMEFGEDSYSCRFTLDPSREFVTFEIMSNYGAVMASGKLDKEDMNHITDAIYELKEELKA